MSSHALTYGGNRAGRVNILRMPAISLWRPWADWVVAGLKPIETRTHRRFKGLVGKRIAIHAGQRWDETALTQALAVIPEEEQEIRVSLREFTIKAKKERKEGALIGTVWVQCFDSCEATPNVEGQALIECSTVQRYGLWLKEPIPLVPIIRMRGGRGIFNVEVPA